MPKRRLRSFQYVILVKTLRTTWLNYRDIYEEGDIDGKN